MVDFPSCYSIQQVELAEFLIFMLFPELRTFIREVTTIERAAGIAQSHALVNDTVEGIDRVYGSVTSLN